MNIHRRNLELNVGLVLLVLAILPGGYALISAPSTYIGQANVDPSPMFWASTIRSANDGEESLEQAFSASESEVMSRQQTEHIRYFLGLDSNYRPMFYRLFSPVIRYVIPLLLCIFTALCGGIFIAVSMEYLSIDWLRRVTDVSANTIMAFPVIITLILVHNIYLQYGTAEMRQVFAQYVFALIVGIVESPRVGMKLRTKIKEIRQSDFIAAAREIMIPHRRIIIYHILFNNCRTIMLIQAIAVVTNFILYDCCVGYLSFPYSQEGWGQLIMDAYHASSLQPWMLAEVSVYLAVLITGLFLVSDGLIKRNESSFHSTTL